MSSQWRLFLEALFFYTRSRPLTQEDAGLARLGAAARYVPLATASIGAAGAAVFWLGALLWPTSIALVLSMLATALLTNGLRETTTRIDALGVGVIGGVLLILLKYNTLMALSAASLPYPAPANVALGLILICGHAAAGSMAVSLIPSTNAPAKTAPSSGDLLIALAVGLAPAALLGIPGLIGLVAAIGTRVVSSAYIKRHPHVSQRLIEAGFYLGALASWRYI